MRDTIKDYNHSN